MANFTICSKFLSIISNLSSKVKAKKMQLWSKFQIPKSASKSTPVEKVTAPKKFAPLAPLPKKPENDPTLRKRSTPIRPAQNKVTTNPQQLPHSEF